jgi:hypothetical protein
MIFAQHQFVILNLFGRSTDFIFFNNSVFIVLPLRSKQLKSLI